MAKFTYNNVKNANTSYILFKLNCSYYPCVFFEDDVDYLCLIIYSANKLADELRNLMTIYQQNLL